MDPDNTSNDSQSRAAERSDADLVDAVLAGDESAFELLFERHRRRVGIIAGRFFQQPEQIAEILQESFTKAYFALKDFSNYKDDSFSSWLARIAFNSCYDELRRRSRGRESSISDITSTDREALRSLRVGVAGDSLESVAVNRDLANKLLSFLSAEDRLVLILLDVEGLSVAEIGQLMNWSSPKVKIRAFRARTDLRRLLRKFL